VFLSVGILRKEEMEEVDPLIKLNWTPSLNKRQKFLAEQVLYGRSTIEDLVDYFGARKNDLIKRAKRSESPGRELMRRSWTPVERTFSSGTSDVFRVNARKARSEVPPTLTSTKARRRYATVTLSEAVFLQVSQSAGDISSVKSRN
jgi:hypothetical protein